jgi:hypothetical protein
VTCPCHYLPVGHVVCLVACCRPRLVVVNAQQMSLVQGLHSPASPLHPGVQWRLPWLLCCVCEHVVVCVSML